MKQKRQKKKADEDELKRFWEMRDRQPVHQDDAGEEAGHSAADSAVRRPKRVPKGFYYPDADYRGEKEGGVPVFVSVHD